MDRKLGKLITLGLLALFLTGCIGTKSNVRSAYAPSAADRFSYSIDNVDGMSAEGLEILNAQLRDGLGTMLAPASGIDAKRVQIRITNYYMRHGAARALVGLMAGKDNITSEVTVVDPATGQLLGSLTVVSSNATAVGTSRGLIQGHAKEIVQFLRTGKGN